MKNLLYIIAFITAVNFCARAELKDVTEGGVVHSAVTFLTNELNARDIEDLLGMNTYLFKVHRSSVTNGLAVSVEADIEGKVSTTIAHLKMDRSVLENLHTDQDIEVLLSLNPVGSLDGEGFDSSKKLRYFLRGSGVKTTGAADNPFYKCKTGVSTWGYPARESAGTFKFMESDGETNSVSPKIELRIRFREF